MQSAVPNSSYSNATKEFHKHSGWNHAVVCLNHLIVRGSHIPGELRGQMPPGVKQQGAVKSPNQGFSCLENSQKSRDTVISPKSPNKLCGQDYFVTSITYK